MDTHRLKNIIICILLLVNLFLLGALGIRMASQRSASQRAAEQLVALFSKDNITLDADRIPSQTPPMSRTLQRDTTLDAALAETLLGKSLTVSDMGGGIYTYASDSGTAQFRANGSFDVVCQLDAGGDPEALCRKLCRQFGYQDIVSSPETETVTAVQRFDGLPVVNCTVILHYQENTLISVSGTHIPDTYTALGDDAPLTAMTALSIFLNERRTSGAVMSAIRNVSLCYQLESSAASPMTLSPAWQITTDTAVYYVNCISGAVSHA